VVVPWAIFMGQSAFAWSSVTARRKAEGYVREIVLNVSVSGITVKQKTLSYVV